MQIHIISPRRINPYQLLVILIHELSILFDLLEDILEVDLRSEDMAEIVRRIAEVFFFVIVVGELALRLYQLFILSMHLIIITVELERLFLQIILIQQPMLMCLKDKILSQLITPISY